MDAYGGQAVIEGVMMRSKNFMSTAVRLGNGKIKVRTEKIGAFPFSKIFFIRGMINLFGTLRMGLKALEWSANQQVGEDESGSWIAVLSVIFGIAAALAVFKLFPFFVASIAPVDNIFLFNLIDASVKLCLFTGYVLAISLFDDVKRIFQYHGAEHKVIGCLEAGKVLSAKDSAVYCKEHRRCGTNFVFTVIVISMLVYLFIPLKLGFWQNFSLRLALLPVIAGVSYEIIKLSGKDTFFTKIISYPGIIMQKLTTREPDKKQLEVAVVAMKSVVSAEKLFSSTLS